MVGQRVGTVLTVLLVAVAVALLAGQLLGQPLVLGYVTTDSMAPAIEPGDGFVAVPAAIAGEPEAGGVVVFEARELHDGGLVTHRVVDETEAGYVTKGDANPFTDQDGPEPPVTEDRIVAHALTVGDAVVTIPGLGTAIVGIRGVALPAAGWLASVVGVAAPAGANGAGVALFAAGLALFAGSVLAEAAPTRSRRTAKRRRRRGGVLETRTVVAVLLVALLLPANLAMIPASGGHDVRIDGDDVAASEGIAPGETVVTEYRGQNNGLTPIVLLFEPKTDGVEVHRTDGAGVDRADSDGMDRVDDPGTDGIGGEGARPRATLSPGESVAVEASLEAPPPDTVRHERVGEYRYLPVLPASALAALHRISPTVALAAVNAVLAAGLVGLLWALGGIGPIRIRGGSGVSITTRLRRRFG